jgi:APA family basic amino acid/polyamine antiporter
MEYAIGNIAVAISWSDYFTSLLKGFNIHIPEYLTMDFLSASRGYAQVNQLLAEGKKIVDIDNLLLDKFYAYADAPSIGNIKLIADLPALAITFIITALVYLGIKESKRASNLMVIFKLLILLIVLAIGAFYVQPEHWNPFAPNGIAGILKGISAVFFAYIGFDAISTTAEECKNPQRDLPRAMIASLIICTILYILIALVLTGMVSYKELLVGDHWLMFLKK